MNFMGIEIDDGLKHTRFEPALCLLIPRDAQRGCAPHHMGCAAPHTPPVKKCIDQLLSRRLYSLYATALRAGMHCTASR